MQLSTVLVHGLIVRTRVNFLMSHFLVSQKYEALFTIRHSISYMPRDTFSDVGDEDMRHSCYAFDVAIAVYVKEVKDLVYAKVTEEIQREIESRDTYRSQRALRRHDALRIWMGEPQPLSTTSHTVLHLIRTVCPGNTGSQVGTAGVQLTPAKVNGQNSQPLDFLVKLMIEFATSPTKQMGPPFLQNGFSLVVFRTAFKEVTRMLASHGLQQPHINLHVNQALTHVFQVRKINHVPWCSNPAPGQTGRPSSKIVYDVWLSLGASSPSSLIKHNSSLLSTEETDTIDAVRASEQMSTKDCRADWHAADVRLIHLHEYLHKTVLPAEWKMTSSSFSSASAFVKNVYRWVKNNYDVKLPLHALAIFVAFAFSGLLPCVDHPKLDGKPSDVRGPQFKAFVSNLDWVEPKRKGVTEVGPFITMVSAFIIALMDQRSPFQSALQDSRSNGSRSQSSNDIKSFFAKHSESFIRCFH